MKRDAGILFDVVLTASATEICNSATLCQRMLCVYVCHNKQQNAENTGTEKEESIRHERKFSAKREKAGGDLRAKRKKKQNNRAGRNSRAIRSSQFDEQRLSVCVSAGSEQQALQ